MQEEQEHDPQPDQEPDPPPEPTDPAFTFTAGEDPIKAARRKINSTKQKAQRAQKTHDEGRVPGQAGGRPPAPRNRRVEHEARWAVRAEELDLDPQDFITITTEHYFMLTKLK